MITIMADMDTFQDGDVILKPDSQSVYEIKERESIRRCVLY